MGYSSFTRLNDYGVQGLGCFPCDNLQSVCGCAEDYGITTGFGFVRQSNQQSTKGMPQIDQVDGELHSQITRLQESASSDTTDSHFVPTLNCIPLPMHGKFHESLENGVKSLQIQYLQEDIHKIAPNRV